VRVGGQPLAPCGLLRADECPVPCDPAGKFANAYVDSAFQSKQTTEWSLNLKVFGT
jgi:hypothetical protein